MGLEKPESGRQRVVIKNVTPCVEGGKYPSKTSVGEKLSVEADIFTDGHDRISARLAYLGPGETEWIETEIEFFDNDRWRGSFNIEKTGLHKFILTAWVDRFKSLRSDMKKRIEAGESNLAVFMLEGAELVKRSSQLADGADRKALEDWFGRLDQQAKNEPVEPGIVLDGELARLMERYSPRDFAVRSPELEVFADRPRARFSAWYEMFPRSFPSSGQKHGTFTSCEALLPYISDMGFDVLYLPPIFPVGHTNRKGRNNRLQATLEDPGTPWAIGSSQGGFKSVNPDLGTLDDFKHLLAAAAGYGLEVALDMAFQCSPDHPYVTEHPEWFVWRPDGTIQYAENPPKKYQDIYPLNFETEDWRSLWEELSSVIFFWIEQGVSIFRVDNPHTKPFIFWQWLLSTVRQRYPEVIFLAEAFTRPKVMYHLAQIGFTQSYTYFAWRNSKEELTSYLTELTRTPVKDYFRPNFWPNTPDILTAYLQTGGRPAFIVRLVLAATLSSNYGIYGPAFELMEDQPREAGSEEYLNSEKYEIKQWDLGASSSLRPVIAAVNRARKRNRALQSNSNLWFNSTDSPDLICYSKHTEDLSNIVYTVVNLNPRSRVSGWVNVPVEQWSLAGEYMVHDLLDGQSYVWNGPWNYVELDPGVRPAHIFRIRPAGNPAV